MHVVWITRKQNTIKAMRELGFLLIETHSYTLANEITHT